MQWVSVMERRMQQMNLSERKSAQSLQSMGQTAAMGASIEIMAVEHHH
jgi:hypothetical protein